MRLFTDRGLSIVLLGLDACRAEALCGRTSFMKRSLSLHWDLSFAQELELCSQSSAEAFPSSQCCPPGLRPVLQVFQKKLAMR